MPSVALYAAIAVGSTAVVWVGSDLLESTSESLAAHYGLPPVVQGAVIAAIGSSFPELATVVLSVVRHGSFDLGVGAIVGSAVFNVLVIPAVSAVGSPRLDADRDVVYKEAQFYMLSVAALLLVFSFGVIYGPTPESGDLVATVTRPLAVVPVCLYGLYLFIQYQDTRDHDATGGGDGNVVRQWALLVLGLALIVVAVEGLIKAALGFGEVLGASSFLWGVTVVAAGTSLPDALVSYRAARDGRGATSLANVFGSNVFDLLVAVPVGVLLVGETEVNFAAAVPLMGFLTLATVALFTVTRTDLTVTTREGVALAGLYLLFVAWMVTETAGLTAFVPGA